MAITINTKFRASTIEGKEGVVYYQVSYNRIIRQIKSGYTLHPCEWSTDEKFVVVDDSNSKRAKQLRLISEKIGYDTRRLYKLAKELEGRGALNHCDDLVFEYSKLPKAQTLFDYIRVQVSQLKQSGRLGTSNNYLATFNSFSKFRGEEDVILDNITPALIEEYDVYLKREKVSMNSISFYMRNLRAVYNKAVKEEIIESQNPFKRVYTGVKKTSREAVTIDDIKRIKNYEVITNVTCEYARDMFLFSFYTRGMSFIDMAHLLKSDLKNGVLSYKKRKKGQPLHIKWETCMQEIVDKYSFADSPYILPISVGANDSNYYKGQLCKVNGWLKKLSKELNLGVTLTMNIARHSWALAAKTKSIPIPIISEGLGHDNETVTMQYLESLGCSYVDGANRMILEDIVG